MARCLNELDLTRDVQVDALLGEIHTYLPKQIAQPVKSALRYRDDELVRFIVHSLLRVRVGVASSIQARAIV
jgi:hypothetical protein